MPFNTQIPRLVSAVNNLANLPRRAVGSPQILRPTDICTAAEQTNITNALATIHTVYTDDIRAQGGDWVALANQLVAQNVSSLNISCDFCTGGAATSSNATSHSLQVCTDTSDYTGLRMWLLIELVRLCGGTELDAWAIKNLTFNISKTGIQWAYFGVPESEKALMYTGGTRQPSPWPYLAGKFTIWDNAMGRLWPSSHSGTNIVPYGQSIIPFNITYWRYAPP